MKATINAVTVQRYSEIPFKLYDEQTLSIEGTIKRKLVASEFKYVVFL